MKLKHEHLRVTSELAVEDGCKPTLEQFFGTARHVERRATGRKRASPALVVRGAVRVVAARASQLQPVSAADLRLGDVAA